MTPERWERVKEVFAEASALPTESRAAFLARACGSDVALRDEVSSLLRAADGGGDSLPGMRAAIGAATRAALESALGQQYEIVRPLGHGGMGTVYLARERALR